MSRIELIGLNEDLIPQAADLWHDGWHDAHATIVPADLTQLRTPDSFAERLSKYTKDTTIAVREGTVLGFCIVLEDEIYQMYVSPLARGTGLAGTLLSDGENRIKAQGHQAAWLACAIGNARAARFYEKAGWFNAGTETVGLETLTDDFPLEIWRFEKRTV